MGFHNDMFQPFSKMGGEQSETLLEKSYSEADTESIDSTPVIQIIERPARRRNFWVVLNFSLLNIAALLTMYFLLKDRPVTGAPLTPADHVFPSTEYETIVFHDQNLRPNEDTNAEWEADLPKGHGFVIVNEPEAVGLPRGMQGGGDHKRYGVTWAHQYHCIWMLRDEFWKFVDGNSTLIGKSLDDDDADGQYMWHLAHCFGYLKQTTICNMDMTLEYPTLGGPNKDTINGYEIPHQCKKRSVFDRFMTQHAPDVELKASEVLGKAKHMHDHGKN